MSEQSPISLRRLVSDQHCFSVVINNEIIGQTSVTNKDGHWLFGITIVPKQRERGYGFLAVQNTCQLVFSDDPRIEELFSHVRTDNAVLLRVLRKAGFSQEDVVRFNGQECHRLILRKKEYLTKELYGTDYVPPFPKVLRIEPASSCNLRCVHCPTGLNMNPAVGIMSWATFKTIYEKIKDYRFRVIVMYHGGEPFLNPNLLKMAIKLRPLAERIELNSNGTILTDRIINQLLEADVIDRLSFSLDGNSPAENDQIRKGANFQKIVSNIKKLINARNKLGFARPRIYIANTQIPNDLSNINEIQVPAFLLEAFKEVEADISYKTTYALIWGGMAIQPSSPEPNNNFCKHTVNTFTIRTNGDVVPCCYDLTTEMRLGNVLEEDPAAIWQGKNFRELRRAIASRNPPKLCRGCEVLYPKAHMTINDIINVM